jgi:hypothetical protein
MGKNAFYNPDFDFWQRGTIFSTPTVYTSVYTADRWNILSTQPCQITQDTDSFAGSAFSMNITSGSTVGSPANNDIVALQQYIEGYEWKYYNDVSPGYQTIWLSFYYKTNFTGQPVYYTLNSGDGSRIFIEYFQISTSGVWTQVTLPISPPGTTGNWNYNNGVGLIFTICLMSGSNYWTSSSLDGWLTNNTPISYARSDQFNFCTSGNYIKFSQMQLQINQLDPVFNSRPYPSELINCQRYYTIMGDGSTTQPFGTGFASTPSTTTIYVPYPTTMRQPPAISYSALTDFNLTTSEAISNIIIPTPGTNAANLSVTPTTALPIADTTLMLLANTSSAKLTFNAELPIKLIPIGTNSGSGTVLSLTVSTTNVLNPGDLILVTVACDGMSSVIINCNLGVNMMTNIISQTFDTTGHLLVFNFKVTQVIAIGTAINVVFSAGISAAVMNAVQIIGTAQQTLDLTASQAGTSSSPSSGSTATTNFILEFAYGAVATVGPDTDTVGTWSNYFIPDTTIGSGTGVSDVFLRTGYYNTLFEAGYIAAMTGITSRPWGAAIATFY